MFPQSSDGCVVKIVSLASIKRERLWRDMVLFHETFARKNLSIYVLVHMI